MNPELASAVALPRVFGLLGSRTQLWDQPGFAVSDKMIEDCYRLLLLELSPLHQLAADQSVGARREVWQIYSHLMHTFVRWANPAAGAKLKETADMLHSFEDEKWSQDSSVLMRDCRVYYFAR